MKDNKVTVTVSGLSATGKSSILYFLKESLREVDIEVEFDGGIDFENESSFDAQMDNISDRNYESIINNTKVVFKEVQETSPIK